MRKAKYTEEEAKERKRQSKLRYYHRNKKACKERHEKWKKENPEKVKTYGKNYLLTENGRAKQMCSRYKFSDSTAGYNTDSNITSSWIIEHILRGSCYYCGKTDWLKLGADRIDNSKPHTPDNCICACWDCNNERNNKYSVEEFKKIKEQNFDLSKKELIFVAEPQDIELNDLAYSGLDCGFKSRFPL